MQRRLSRQPPQAGRNQGATMSEVKTPPEFCHLVRSFYQGSRTEVNDEREWIALALRMADAHSKSVVKQFLTDLLAQKSGEKELQELWNSAGGNYYIVGKHGHEAMRSFLTMILDQIA
jgi:hypothetical protein